MEIKLSSDLYVSVYDNENIIYGRHHTVLDFKNDVEFDIAGTPFKYKTYDNGDELLISLQYETFTGIEEDLTDELVDENYLSCTSIPDPDI